jgi:hypothetical protein
VRVKAMEVLNKNVVDALITSLQNDNIDEDKDDTLTVLNDVILELFQKIKDIYCVLPALETITKILEKLVQIKENQIFT